MPIPGTPPGAANDFTVASADLQSGEEQDGFVSVFPRGGVDVVEGHRVTSTTVFPFQANRFAVFDVEIVRNDRPEQVRVRHCQWFEAPRGSTSEA